jgi:septal ring factor EnvC (AmiA/AmiB activator)
LPYSFVKVEAEVSSLQEALAGANDKLQASAKERRRLEKRISVLELSIGQIKGQEYAIDVANKQNTWVGSASLTALIRESFGVWWSSPEVGIPQEALNTASG